MRGLQLHSFTSLQHCLGRLRAILFSMDPRAPDAPRLNTRYSVAKASRAAIEDALTPQRVLRAFNTMRAHAHSSAGKNNLLRQAQEVYDVFSLKKALTAWRIFSSHAARHATQVKSAAQERDQAELNNLCNLARVGDIIDRALTSWAGFLVNTES